MFGAAKSPGISDGSNIAAESEKSLQQINDGDIRGAAETIRRALQGAPNSIALHELAGTVLLMTGDLGGATNEWNYVREKSPDNGLATYALGLVNVSKGDRIKALDCFQLALHNGDSSACSVAIRYLECLNGVVVNGNGLIVSDYLLPSSRALASASSMRSGNMKQAVSSALEAINMISGDPFTEPAGVCMSFDPVNPYRFGSAALPTGTGLGKSKANSGEKVYSGTITLSPDNVGSDTGSVVFKVDGDLKSLLNTYPYQYVWNTAHNSNGIHRLEIVVYDKQGQVTNKAEKEIYTSNADAPSGAEDRFRIEQLEGSLWRLLALRPSRHALAYLGAEASRASGDLKTATTLMDLAAGMEPGYRETRNLWKGLNPSSPDAALWRGASDEKVVAFTFDDGPKPGTTEMLLNVLKQEGVPATFFVIGRHATAHPELVKLIAASGMEVENHSYTHPNLTALPPEYVERELVRTISAIRDSTGKRPKYFRPPGGNLNNEVTRLAAQWGMTPCMWTVDGDALEVGPPDRLIDFVLTRTQPGGIVLLHNGRPTTVEAMPKIIDGLRKKGYQFVTIEELARRKSVSAVRADTVKPGG